MVLFFLLFHFSKKTVLFIAFIYPPYANKRFIIVLVHQIRSDIFAKEKQTCDYRIAERSCYGKAASVANIQEAHRYCDASCY